MVSVASFSILCFLFTSLALAVETPGAREIRTYLSFNYPIDPARTGTLPEMNISRALGSTLTEWDDEREISAGLAQEWKVVGPHTYRLKLAPRALWSNGMPITSTDVKRSLERGLRLFKDDMRCLSHLLESISCPSNREIDFHLKTDVHSSGLLRKLAEPKYAILYISNSGQPDLQITSGPFSLDRASSAEQLTLTRNNQYSTSNAAYSTVDRILIRKPLLNMNLQSVLFSDPWPNFVETISITESTLAAQYLASGFQIRTTSVDKLFYIQLGRRSTHSSGVDLLKFLRTHLDESTLMKGLTGYSNTSQVFPRGYPLFEANFLCEKIDEVILPRVFLKRPIKILYSSIRVPLLLQQNLSRALQRITGFKPIFKPIPLETVNRSLNQEDFDFYIGTMGLTEPDPDETLAFFFESEAPIIYPYGNQFLSRFDSLRTETNKSSKYTKMERLLKESICSGYLLPLFHLSTVGIGRPEIDLSKVPNTDESIRLSKIGLKSPEQVITAEAP